MVLFHREVQILKGLRQLAQDTNLGKNTLAVFPQAKWYLRRIIMYLGTNLLDMALKRYVALSNYTYFETCLFVEWDDISEIQDELACETINIDASK